MIISKAAKRYARAFFEIAQEKDCLDTVKDDFVAVDAAIEGSSELNSFLKAPLIASEKRIEVLKTLFTSRINKLSLEFLLFLERKSRLGITQDTVIEFAGLYDQLKDIQRVSISSAFEMESAQVEAIKKRLQEKLNKNIIAEVIVEPALIGGFKIKVGDQVHDLSIETQLKKLKQSIVKA
jgi:F-type H+-transporting ATPase subunit delta